MLVYFRDRSAQAILGGATLRQKLQIQLSTSPSHGILTLGQPVLVLTLQCQAPGRVATGVPIFKSLVWLDPEKSHRTRPGKIPSQAGFEPLIFSSRGLNHLANEAISCGRQQYPFAVKFSVWIVGFRWIQSSSASSYVKMESVFSASLLLEYTGLSVYG